jgi:predicted nucleic acid-binding Zn ribbon protein
MEVTKIVENSEILKKYLSDISDINGRLSISIHKSKLKNLDRSAILCYDILSEYIITLQDLKHILNKNLIVIRENCPVCGKPVDSARNKYCSVKCSSLSNETKGKFRHTCLIKYGVGNPAQVGVVKEKIKQTNLERYGVENPYQSEEIKEKIKQTNLDRYGVEQIFQSENFKEKSKHTCLDRYGVESPIQSRVINEKIRKTNLSKYGVENPYQSEEIKEKIKQTNLDRYGVEYSSQSKIVKERIKETNLDKYGVEYSWQAEEIKEKVKQTCLERYGVENIQILSATKEKAKRNNLKKYGAEHPSQSGKVKEKIKQTCLNKYNTDVFFRSKEFKEKSKLTSLEKYGTEHPSQSDGVKEKIKRTCLEKYGVEYPLKSEEIKEKSRQTSLEHFGIENPLRSEDIRNKIKLTCLEKYGVENPYQAEEIQKKIKQTNLDKYGVEYSWQAEETKEKIKETWLDKYGTTNPLKTEVVRRKVKKTQKIRKYDFFLKLLKSKNIEMLSSYDEHLVNDVLKFRCFNCNTEFEADYHASIQHLILCPNCYKKRLSGRSVAELDILNFIRNLGFSDAMGGSMKIIPPLQLDVFIPSKNLAIEYDGIYWHSSSPANTPKDYHLNKTIQCRDKGIQLLHVFENEWLYKQEIVKSIIKSKLGIYDEKIYARKCEVKELSNQEYQEFVDLNHIQGHAGIWPKIKLGLFYNNELVSCIGIGKSRFKSGETELIRFCNKLNTSVVGGLSRLIKRSGVNDLVSYVDLRYFNGSGYEKAGFKLVSQSGPGYIYVKGSEILSRRQCQKHKLPKLLGDKFDPNLTEVENMTLAGYHQIFDCGNLKYKFISK